MLYNIYNPITSYLRIKIVLLIRRRSHMVYLANRIHKHAGLAAVIVEDPRCDTPNASFAQRLMHKLKADGPLVLLDPIKERVTSVLHRRRMGDAYFSNMEKYRDEYFGDDWKELDSSIPVITVSSINQKDLPDRIREYQPDLLLCQGTSIVRAPVLDTAPLTLNLHWGLSPYYRGTHCTEWALLNWDPYNIGVTVHKLTSEIDGGDILAQSRAVVSPDHSVGSLNMQLTRMGTDLLCTAIDHLKSGKKLVFHSQDFSKGFVYYLRQWQSYFAKIVELIERDKMKKILKNPARETRLPIIELD
jgi:hypothetical protein